MKYILLHNLDSFFKEKTLNGYLSEGYNIIYESDSDIIIKNINEEIVDEDKYIKITISILKRNNFYKTKSKIIDLSTAFNYAKSIGIYDKCNNKFDWYIRNIITYSFNN